MGNAGEARLDVVALARDEVTVIMNKVSGEIDQLKAKLAGYEKAQRGTGAAATDAAKATNGLVTQMTALKGQAGGVNKVREAFENLRSNFFFVAGAAAGVVASIAGIAQALNTNNIYIAEWESVSKSVTPAIESTKDAVRALREELGELAPQTNLEKILDGLETKLLGLTDKLEKAQAGVTAFESELERVAAFDFTGLATTLGAVEDIEKDRNFALAKAIELTDTLTDATTRYVAALMRVPNDANTFVGPSPDAAPNDANTFVGPNPSLAPDRQKPPGGGGGRRVAPVYKMKTVANWDAFLEALIAESVDVAGMRESEGSAGNSTNLGEGEGMGAAAVRANDLADALARVAESTEMVNEAMPGYAAILSEIQVITDKVVEGKMSLNDALVAGGAAIAANAAKAIGGVRLEAAARAVYEYYMGFATLANPVISGGHFIAAAGLTAFAAGAGVGGGGGGKSGGGARASGASSANDNGGGGNITNVFNISTLVTDPHAVVRANQQSSRSTAGTGLDTRRGA